MRSAIAAPILFLLVSFFVQECESVGFAPELYCGLENCYDGESKLSWRSENVKTINAFIFTVLEVNREEFDKQKLAKAYRALARKHHPDRVKNKEEKLLAEERFRVIATAYETLKDDEAKTNYDYYLDHPDQRYDALNMNT